MKLYFGQEHHKTNYLCLTADGLGVARKKNGEGIFTSAYVHV